MTKYRGPIRAFSASLPTMMIPKLLLRPPRVIPQFQKMSISTSQILHAQSAKNQVCRFQEMQRIETKCISSL